MSDGLSQVLLLCYGNPGRLDDGLGPTAGEILEREDLPGVTVDVDYQLTVEHAAAASECDVVIFVDAAVDGREPFFFRPVEPQLSVGFSSHGVEPDVVLGLAGHLMGSMPQGYALGIRGYDFDDFGEALSPRAADNLTAALHFLVAVVKERGFQEAVTAVDGATADGGAVAPATANGGSPCEGEMRCETGNT